MPIYFSKSGYGYTYKSNSVEVKNKKFNYKKLFRVFMFLLIIVILIITIEFIFEHKNNDNAIELYALQIAEYDDYNTATVFSEQIKKQGGAGYMHLVDGKYKILVSCYENLGDAEQVRNNLNGNGYQLSITTLTFNDCWKNISLSQNQTKTLNEIKNIFIDNYSQLYNLSVKYDTNNITLNEFKTKIGDLYYKNNEKIEKFSKDFKDCSLAQVIYFKIYLNNMQGELKDLLNCKLNISSKIKETYFNILFLDSDLRQNK